MPALSFRTKLLLAMTLVVTGVSATTLVMTQRRLQENYELNLRRQFEQQISYFVALQDTRLETIKQQCLNLSQLVRLIAALKEPNIDPDTLYQNASDDLRRLLNTMRDENRRGRPPVSRAGPNAVFTFLDSEGHPLQPSEHVRQQLGLWFPKRPLEQRLARIRDALKSPERQQIGYLGFADAATNLAPAFADRRSRARLANTARDPEAPPLQEFILTKIVDEAVDNAVVGAIILGFPLPELIPLPATNHPGFQASQQIRSGIFLQNHLYANPRSLPEAEANEVAEQLEQRIEKDQQQGDFETQIGAAQFRVFYQWLNPGSSFPPAYQVCLYSLQEAHEQQRNLRWKILGSGLIALIGALLISLFLSHGFAVPIKELVAGTGEIRRGNFQVQVPVRSRDEIGQLAGSFNDMAQGLALKEKYRTALNMVADEKVAQKMVAGDITLGGELREVSVLFCDIRGFTALTQGMPPQEVITLLNEHMTVLTRVVKKHNGLVDKFVGDMLMALFGAPVSHGNHALDAAQCALGLLEEREKLNQTSTHRLQVGIGITTGQVVAGGMGSADRLNYTALGERVNLASRLCSHALPGEILIDQATAALLKDELRVERASELQLKGFSAPVQAYRLISKTGSLKTELSDLQPK